MATARKVTKPVVTVMPGEDDSPGNSDSVDISYAICDRITDDIEDSKSLRDKREILLCILGGVAALFYILLVIFIGLVIFCPKAFHLAYISPTVCITILVSLSAIPTIICVSVAKAVFGKKAQAESPFTPLHAIIQLMKDVKS